MSPQRFNRILLLVVVIFMFFSVVAYAASGSMPVAASAHKGLCTKMEDTEMVWETIVRKAVIALVRR